MIVLAFFSWWYGAGWLEVAHSLPKRLTTTNHTFSVTLLLRTLFSPWRRIITYPGASIGDHMRALGDNAISRVIGFIVRLLVLLVAFLATILVVASSIVELVVWPLLPPAIIAGIVLGSMR